MDPFRNHQQAAPVVIRHCPLGRCPVCCSQPLLVRKEFAALIRRSWSLAEVSILGQAARSAML